MLSLNETARRHDVSKAGLSQAVHAGRPIKGMSLHRFAVVEEGEIQGFEFPDWYSIPEEDEGEEEEALSGDDLFDEEESDDSDEDETDGGSKAAQGLLALGSAIAVSALTSQ